MHVNAERVEKAFILSQIHGQTVERRHHRHLKGQRVDALQLELSLSVNALLCLIRISARDDRKDSQYVEQDFFHRAKIAINFDTKKIIRTFV